MTAKCSVCCHSRRSEIDAALVIGTSLRNVAKQFRVGYSAVNRHKVHLPATLATAHKAVEVTRADDLLQQLGALLARAIGILDRAERSDPRTALSAIREARGCLELLGRLSGELQEQHRIQIAATPAVPANISLADAWSEVALACRGLSRAAMQGRSTPPTDEDKATIREAAATMLRSVEETRRDPPTVEAPGDGVGIAPPMTERESDALDATEADALDGQNSGCGDDRAAVASVAAPRAGNDRRTPEPRPESPPPEPEPERQRDYEADEMIRVPIHRLFPNAS